MQCQCYEGYKLLSITFGGLASDKTHNLIGISETLVSASVVGLIFHALSGQPLTIGIQQRVSAVENAILTCLFSCLSGNYRSTSTLRRSFVSVLFAAQLRISDHSNLCGTMDGSDSTYCFRI